MSTPFDQKGPAQPTEVDQKDKQGEKPAGSKTEQSRKDDADLPGADGPSSAGANEDTYD
jgi:hypothetical protein